jgi:hypothetical protein
MLRSKTVIWKKLGRGVGHTDFKRPGSEQEETLEHSLGKSKGCSPFSAP